MKGISSEQFIAKYLPDSWAEIDLQRLIHKRLNRGLPGARMEARVRTPSGNRRADVTTWNRLYEVKKWLTYEDLKSAKTQLDIYAKFGARLLGVIPKRKTIIGLAPTGLREYRSAKKLAQDIRAMGCEVIFINESPEWFPRESFALAPVAIAFSILLAGLSGYAVVSAVVPVDQSAIERFEKAEDVP